MTEVYRLFHAVLGALAMRCFRRLPSKNCRDRLFRLAIWVILVTIFPLSALGALPKPLIVENPYVPAEVLRKIRKIGKASGPLLILNPYAEPLEFGRNSPYLRKTPTPQIVFPAKWRK